VHGIEHVDRELHEGAAGGFVAVPAPFILAEAAAAGVRYVPLGHGQGAEAALVEERLDGAVGAVVASAVADHEGDAGGAAGANHGGAVLDGVGDGLVGEDVLAGGGGALGGRAVMAVGGEDGDGFDVGAVEERVDGGRDVAGASLREALGGLGAGVPAGSEFDFGGSLRALPEGGGVVRGRGSLLFFGTHNSTSVFLG